MNPISKLTAHRRLKRQMTLVRPRLFRLAWSWCHNSDLAEDLVQDAFVRGLSKLDQLRDHDQLEVWLCRIMANLHRDYLRKRREELGLETETVMADGGPENDINRSDDIDRVRKAIAQLNEDQRMVLTLVDLMDHSYASVASILEIPVGTVMSRLSRARNRLKTLLSEPTPARVHHLKAVK